MQNFIKKIKLTELLIFEFLVLKITISNVVSKKRKPDDLVKTGKFRTQCKGDKVIATVTLSNVDTARRTLCSPLPAKCK